MRRIAMLLWACCGALVGCASSSKSAAPAPEAAASHPRVASVTVFYDALAPYGEWVFLGDYGRVWRPSVAVVGAGFRPYGPGGYWVHTAYGWSFETEWSWGWAPFHYGRWYLDPGYGWVWIPDTIWAPAWVTWRYGGGYVGWAPLPPTSARIVVETYHPYWCFVATEHFVVRDPYHYAVPVQNYHAAFTATASVSHQATYGGAVWNAGPPPGQVSQEIGRPVHTAAVTPPPGGVPQPHQLSGVGATAHPIHGSPANSGETAAPANQPGAEKSAAVAEKSPSAQRKQPKREKEPRAPAQPKSVKRKKH
ncbi:MAG TPA: DUF6600 domain-containing protein [Myxococcaceae bacterium]|nr:DUF6600 domain-containing protein [Myxococcaceae bacterium]